MHKIERESKIQQLPLHQRIKRQQMQNSVGKHFDQESVDAEVDRITRAKCQSCFKVQTRDQVENALRNRTNTPAVGHYSPRFGHIDKRGTKHYEYIQEEELNDGVIKKRDLNLSQMKICPQAIRALEDWGTQKAKMQHE